LSVFRQLDLYIQDKYKLFDTLVGSVLDYRAELFGYYDCKNIEFVHCKFLKMTLCVRKSTTLDALYGDIGRYLMAIHRKTIILKYENHLITQFLKQMYSMLKEDADNELSYWETGLIK
jgi:hypothetical protein